jgi:hypothetical protein
MRKISSAELALAAALFAVSGATALADSFNRQQDSQPRAAMSQPVHGPASVPVSVNSDSGR